MWTVRVYLLNASQSKLKKIRELYGDQDEEERELKMKLLAVSKNDPCEISNAEFPFRAERELKALLPEFL